MYPLHLSQATEHYNYAYPAIHCQGTRRVDVYMKIGSKATSNVDY